MFFSVTILTGMSLALTQNCDLFKTYVQSFWIFYIEPINNITLLRNREAFSVILFMCSFSLKEKIRMIKSISLFDLYRLFISKHFETPHYASLFLPSKYDTPFPARSLNNIPKPNNFVVITEIIIVGS